MFMFILHWTGVMQHYQFDVEAIDKTMQAK